MIVRHVYFLLVLLVAILQLVTWHHVMQGMVWFQVVVLHVPLAITLQLERQLLVFNVRPINILLVAQIHVIIVQLDAQLVQVQLVAVAVQQVVALVVMVYLALVVLNVHQTNILLGQVDVKHVQADALLVQVLVAATVV